MTERVGLIRSLRELTLWAAFGRLSRGYAALGSDQCVHFHHPRQVNKKEATRASFLSTGGGASLARRMLSGGSAVLPVPLIRTEP